ncbi:MAG: aldo/keto reductase [Planctomycetota bacterium]|nr:aldo/keto reductase [Planctomycetota bacterium]
MLTRPLGSSGIPASAVGFGAWTIGGWMWGGADEAESIRAIHAFLDAGGTLIDTAPVYGFGRSEELVGKAIAGRRDKVILATKCSMRWDLSDAQKTRAARMFSTTSDEIIAPGDAAADTFDVSIYNGRDGIREEVERSLRRLGTDVIDLYQTHWQIDSTPIAERMGALEELRREGKIRAIGVCNATPDIIADYRRHGTLDSDQEKYSMLDRAMDATNLPVCARDSIAFLAYGPLAQGLLTGAADPNRQYPPGDQRRTKARYKPDNIRAVVAMLEPVRAIAARHAATVSQVVIAWTLAQRGCSHVLCGARTAAQAIENARGGSLQLSPDELRVISAAVARYTGV